MSKRKMCFFCDGEKEYVLNGYEPCNNCEERFKKGILFVEVSTDRQTENQSFIEPGSYPTGRYWIISEENVREKVRKYPILRDKLLKTRRTIAEQGMLIELGLIEEEIRV